MTLTNSGNSYKFQTILKRRSSVNEVAIYSFKKDGSRYSKPAMIKLIGDETPEDVLKRIQTNNPTRKFELA